MPSPLTKIQPTVSLVVPIFNSEKTAVSQLVRCEKILRSICKTYEIIICDDKSTDNTAKILEQNFRNRRNISLIFHNKNQGIARTILSLYKKAKNDFIILFSVDGDWVPEDINKLLKTTLVQNADITIGVRKTKNYSLYRKGISFLYNYLPQLLFGVKTYDAGSIKVIKKSLFDTTPIISKSVFFEAELIIKATKKGYNVVPCPIQFMKKDKHIGKGGKFSLALHSFADMIKLRTKNI